MSSRDESEDETKRVSEQCLPVIEAIHKMDVDTEEQREKIDEARELIEWVREDDLEANGPGPTDQLAALLEGRE